MSSVIPMHNVSRPSDQQRNHPNYGAVLKSASASMKEVGGPYSALGFSAESGNKYAGIPMNERKNYAPHIVIPKSAEMPDPVAAQLKREGYGVLVEKPNQWFPWAPLYNPQSPAYYERSGGPLQTFRFANEASQLERLVFSYENVRAVRRKAAQMIGLGDEVLIDDQTAVHFLKQVYYELVPYGDMATPSFMRGVYRPNFLERQAVKITDQAAVRAARNVAESMAAQDIYFRDGYTHLTRGVVDIPPPAWGGKDYQQLCWTNLLPTPSGF